MKITPILLAIVFCISLASAFEYNIQPECYSKTCIQGEEITWRPYIKNNEDDELEIRVVYLRDFATKNIIDFANVDEELDPGESKKFELSSVAPGYDLNVLPCFKMKLDDWEGFREMCPLEGFPIEIYSGNEIECDPKYPRTECDQNTVCADYKCIPIVCGECQYRVGRSCYDHECCSDGVCGDKEICKDNECSPLICNSYSFPFDHICIECANDEISDGTRCIKLECPDDATQVNHKCKRIYCNLFEVSRKGQCEANLFLAVIVGASVFLAILAYVFRHDIKKRLKKKEILNWNEFQKKLGK